MTHKLVPSSNALTWIKTSIKIGSTQYGLFLGIGLVVALTAGLVSLVPIVGPIAAGVLGFLYGVASFRFVQKVMAREPVSFETYFNFAFDAQLYNKFRPYLIAVLVASTISALNLRFGYKPIGGLVAGVVGIFNAMCAYAAFREWNEVSLNPQARLKEIFDGLLQNFLTVIFFAVLCIVFAIGCALLCVAPLFFFFLPMMIASRYLMFSTIFDNMDADEELKRWTLIAAEVKGT